ncbi:UNVERIFIED_CONTAM: hypothetical protein Sradi_3335300 [Sesamum radiatum]|uniref:Reverse transcriptase zinc-binding domain-containing protein n=1 Tax=Sesamum radiatum TaxID=300843 RepID=A0AAW2R2B7_SESRA
MLPVDVVRKVADIPFDESSVDSPCWKVSPTGSFNVKTAWDLIRDGRLRRPLLKELWYQTIFPSISIFMWRLIHNFVPVDERLREKGIPIVSKCLCCQQSETIPHLFLNSVVIREVWVFFGALFHLIPPLTDHSQYDPILEALITFCQAWSLGMATGRVWYGSARTRDPPR